MEIKRLQNDWLQITKKSWILGLVGIKLRSKKYKHLTESTFPHSPHRGVYMCEKGKILSPFYSGIITILDNFRNLEKYS